MMLKNIFLMPGTVASRRLIKPRFAGLAPTCTGLKSFSTAIVKPKNGTAMHIDSYKQDDSNYSIDIRLASHVHIPYSLDTTLKTINDALYASKNDDINKVQFFTLTGSRLPLCEKIANLRQYPVLLQINDDRIFAINFSQEYAISRGNDHSSAIHDEEHYFDIARDIGLKGYELFSLPYFAHKLMQALPPKQELSSTDVTNSLTQVLRYMTTKNPEGNKWTSRASLSSAMTNLNSLED